MILFSYIFL